MRLIPVRVSGLAIDERTKSPVVLLQEIEGPRVLPIWIGPTEAGAIHSEITGKRFQRPLTHDLLVSMVEGLHGKISRVVITDLKESTFFANIFLDGGQGAVSIDARPSDSIAIALRSRAPIFIVDFLFDKSAQTVATTSEEPQDEKSPEAKAEELRRFLEDLRPEDFGGQWKSEDL